MKYCVKKDTTIVIDGSENQKEVMLQNAKSMGFTENDVEIITEEEYKTRVEISPKQTQTLTLEERIALLENLQLQQGGIV